MRNRVIIVLSFLILGAVKLYAGDDNQKTHSISINIPEVALLSLEGGTSISLTPTAPTEAGGAFDFSTAVNNDIWVNYSSIISGQASRNVTAQITSGTVPSGLAIKIKASEYSSTGGGGKGTFGISTGVITLDGTAKNVLTGVKSCYTGTGENNGHNLQYTLELDSNTQDAYSLLSEGSTPITVMYTLTDDK